METCGPGGPPIVSAGTARARLWRRWSLGLWRRFRRGNRRTSSATIYHENNAQGTVRYALGLFDSARIWRCSSSPTIRLPRLNYCRPGSWRSWRRPRRPSRTREHHNAVAIERLLSGKLAMAGYGREPRFPMFAVSRRWKNCADRQRGCFAASTPTGGRRQLRPFIPKTFSPGITGLKAEQT
jgi:hypothetical protein